MNGAKGKTMINLSLVIAGWNTRNKILMWE